MRVLVAPQEFKGTLKATEAADVIAEALAAAFPAFEVDRLPMADGGPGTLDALLAASGGVRRVARVHDPLLREVEADWGLLPDGTAIIECAAASGLWRLAPGELDPLRASTLGTGELLAVALDADCGRIILGLGGSGTNDGGAGMAQALGFRLLDAAGKPLRPGGAALAGLERIDVSDVDPALTRVTVLGATDVTNPLLGPRGASAVYGPQKGADAAAVLELDAALARLAEVIKRDLGVDVTAVVGGGAAGGLGAGVVAFLGGRLRPGAELVGEAAGLGERVAAADVVVTGEGQLDGQTAYGKAPRHVAALAKSAGKPVVCIAGRVGEGWEQLRPLFDVSESASAAGLAAPPTPLEAREQVQAATLRAFARLFATRPA